MKQKRNKKCKCGSGIKYKKCCKQKDNQKIITITPKKQFYKELNQLSKLTEENIIISDETVLSRFRNSNEIKYIVGLTNLPSEIREGVLNLIKILEPKVGQCELFSSFISLNIPGVRQVRGFFSDKHRKQNGEKYINLKYNPRVLEYDMVYSDDMFRDILDVNGQVWGTHSWNEYNGIHFDCLKDFLGWNENHEWLEYKTFTSFTLNDIVSNGTLNSLNTTFPFVSQSMSMERDIWINNKINY
jgi:hypothetical protein